jgi:hypothetical protein
MIWRRMFAEIQLCMSSRVSPHEAHIVEPHDALPESDRNPQAWVLPDPRRVPRHPRREVAIRPRIEAVGGGLDVRDGLPREIPREIDRTAASTSSFF